MNSHIDSERFLKHNHLKRVADFDYLNMSDEDREKDYQASKMRFNAVLMIIKYISERR
jgi:hypothetical protein